MNRFHPFRIESLEDRRLFAGLDGDAPAQDAPVDNTQPAEVGQPNTPTAASPQKPVVSLPEEVHITSEELQSAFKELDKEPEPTDRPTDPDLGARETVDDVLDKGLGDRVAYHDGKWIVIMSGEEAMDMSQSIPDSDPIF